MALADLKKLGILHANLKPDSVMLVDEEDLRIKIISFGLALLEHEATPGITIQAPGLRCFLLQGPSPHLVVFTPLFSSLQLLILTSLSLGPQKSCSASPSLTPWTCGEWAKSCSSCTTPTPCGDARPIRMRVDLRKGSSWSEPDLLTLLCPQMKHLVTLLGQPPEHMLDAGRHTSRYFQNVANASGFSWRLKVRMCSSPGAPSCWVQQEVQG